MTSLLWKIPQGWLWTTMGDVNVVVGGGTPSTADLSNYENGEVPWITPADLSGYREKFIGRGQRNITRKGLENSGARLMPRGTVLFSSRAPIGYVAIAANELATNQGFKSFIPPEGIFPDYLYYYLQRAKDQAIELASGTTFLEISGTKAALIPLPIAPFNEQQRIVSEIEKQLTRLDAAVAALKRVQANLKRYRASVLKAACEGRLVPIEAELARKQGRDYEPADQLLARILKERRTKWEEDQLAKMIAAGKPPKDDDWKKKYSEPVALDTSNLPKLPEGWIWASADQLTDETRAITYGVIKLGDDWLNGTPVLRSSDVRHLRLELDHVKCIKPVIAEKYARTFLKGNEILITVRGTLGGVAIVPEACRGFNISREVAMLSLVCPSLAPALAEIIASPQCQNWLLLNTVGIAYTGVNIERLKQLPIPLPPMEEQARIHSAVDRQLTVGDRLQNSVAYELMRLSQLRQSVLQAAFEGKLVSQDPNDEPASVLLERIRSERGNSVPRAAARQLKLARTRKDGLEVQI